MTRSIAVIDAETDPFLFGRIPKPFLWGFYDGINFKTFDTSDELAELIKTQNIIVYAHNGGKFDHLFLLDHIEPFERMLIINSRLTQFRLGSAEMRDSYSIIPAPLRAYKKGDMDYSIMEESERDKPHNREKIVEYLRDDCIYLFELVEAFRERFGDNITQASTAMKQWKKISGLKPPRMTREQFTLFDRFYYGGRVQCFRTGIVDEHFSVADINSAYPFAMLYQHPFRPDFAVVEEPCEFSPDVRYFYRLECESHGAFPYREKSGLAFPNDGQRREFFVTDWEYHTAKNAGLLRGEKFVEGFMFASTTDFSQYVMKFYDERKRAKKEGDKLTDLFSKLLMNSLYGKFGSDYQEYEHYMSAPVGDRFEAWEEVGRMSEAMNLISRPLDESEMKFFNVATAASITGFVRAYLLAAITRVGFDNMLYCDTDSIAARDISSLDIHGELGGWKNEGLFDRAGISGKKMYIFKKNKNCPIYAADKKKDPETKSYKSASKGVKLSEAQLWRVAKGGVEIHNNDAPSMAIGRKTRFVSRRVKMTKNI